jgi:hypothetical protein
LQQHVFFESHEEHWYGAVPDRLMTHLAMLKVDAEGTSASWGEHVTDDEYSQPISDVCHNAIATVDVMATAVRFCRGGLP